jgi:NADPH:quinone reductase-like Zn-dependent oxidoreductase/acyl carrier protein
VWKRPADEVWCHARISAPVQPVNGKGPARRTVDLAIADESGAIAVEILGLAVQQLAAGAQRREEDDWFLEVEWERAAVPAAKLTEGRWLLLGAGPAAALGAALTERGHRVVQAPAAPLDVAKAGKLLADAFGGQPPTAVVHLGSLECDSSLDAAAVEAALVNGCDGALAMVRAVAAKAYRDPPRLWLVTRGAQAVHGSEVWATQAPLLGLGRVVAMEHAELRCARLDLDGARPDGELEALLAELLGDDSEEEVALRGGERYVSRLDRKVPDAERKERIEPPGARSFRMDTDKPGVLEHLVLRATERRAPAAGEVEIAVQAAGLNFADVMQAMGFAFGFGGGPVTLGGECAGRVTAVGEGVKGIRVGQEVMAFAPFSFGSHVLANERMVAPRPATLSPAEAAALPAVLMTAWYGLVHVARLRAGDRVLIHSATGGTGQAAMQIARHLGAEIFATAGTEEKRAWLREQGVKHVMDSRTLDFAEQVLEATQGQGVDVVFNSLSRAAIEAGIAALAPDGRFIEIGKRDIYDNRPLELGHFKKGITYSHVDLAGLAVRRPGLVADLMHEVVDLLAKGALQPIPVETFPISRATEAFYKMAQARHTGKLALTLDDPDITIRVPIESGVTVRADRSYLITGGLGGLGLSVARWLADQGAGHLVLAGRSGAATAAQQEAVAAIQATGKKVSVVKADVSDRAQVESLLRVVDGSGMPLAGIVHAAGFLDDGLLVNQDPSRFRKVMAPKIQGALHLHALTRDLPIEFFVMYSSGTGLLGSPGQSNYAAANTFLDALAHLRRSQGLAGLSIDWAAFSEVGLAAAQENRGARIASQGMRSLTPAEGLSALARLLDSDRAQTGVVPINVRQWVEFHPAAASSRRLTRLVSAQRAGVGKAGGDPEVMKRLAAAGPEEKAALIAEVLCKHVSHVLRIPEGKVDVKAPLTSLGMDSLMGLELRNRIEASLGVTVPATLLWTYPTVTALSLHLAGGPPKEAAPAEPAQPARDFAADAKSMTGSEAARLIDEEFEELQ